MFEGKGEKYSMIRKAVSVLLIISFVVSSLVGCQVQGTSGEADQKQETGTEDQAGEKGKTDAVVSEEGEESQNQPEEDKGTEPDVQDEDEPDLSDITLPYFAEAEDGSMEGVKVEKIQSGYSGTGYVGRFEQQGNYVEVEIPIPEDGTYEIKIRYFTPFGNKTNNVYVDDRLVEAVTFPESKEFAEKSLGTFNLEKGLHTARFQNDPGSWGWMYVDSFIVDRSTDQTVWNFDIKPSLVNPNADEKTKKVYEYLVSIYGKKTLAAQQLYYSDEREIKEIESVTGKLPAIKGYDMINQTPGGQIDHQVQHAIDWHVNHKGLVVMCWHWRAPKGGRSFYTDETTFDITKAVTPGTEEYELVLRDMDAVAEKLKEMEEAGVPVLWRPLHEASGGWFWWGAKGPEPYIQLWRMMFDRFTNYHKLNNLIWVWNSQHPDWFVGDEYYDIAGEDIYVPEGVYTAHPVKFGEVYETIGGKKPIALTENGPIPDPDHMKETGAMWLWFMPWWGDFILDPKYTDREMLKKVYNHELVITLDELPDFEAGE
jgi:mannan endo-1,4-beta-mannosidase